MFSPALQQMEAAYRSETLVLIYQTKRCCDQEDGNMNLRRCEYLKSYITFSRMYSSPNFSIGIWFLYDILVRRYSYCVY
jgi:hypothetical protein